MPTRPMLFTVAACGLIVGLAACQRREEVLATPGQATTPVPAEATHLWRIEVMSDGKAASTLDICADRNVRSSFSRPTPELEGKPCVRVADPVEKGATYAVRCRIDDQLYRVGSVTAGDRDQDFTVEMAVTRQDMTAPILEQVRRYRRLGECPVGWKIGDSAAPGARQVVNTLTGEVRPLAGGASG